MAFLVCLCTYFTTFEMKSSQGVSFPSLVPTADQSRFHVASNFPHRSLYWE